MMALAIGLNLLPVFLTALAPAYGSDGASLNAEQLGRLGASLFAGLVVGILITALLSAGFAPDYLTLGLALLTLGLGAGILNMVLSPVVAAPPP
jgi:F0F1-type ATP synthase assembly protein I